MVLLKYKGQNYISFGNRKIVNGVNDIPDDEFYKLMKFPTFKSRVLSNKFTVPFGFPLDAPKKDVVIEEKIKDTEDEEETNNERFSVKQMIKNIHHSDDIEYLNSLIHTDDRQKVKEAAQKKLDSLDY